MAGQKMSFAAKTPGQVREFFIFPHLRHPAAPRLWSKTPGTGKSGKGRNEAELT
jgi:hypothetical protein